MRDDQHGAPLHEVAQRLLDHELALGIEVRRRLVEDQDRRILEEGAGDGQALALAAAEPHAALAHQRGVALRAGQDELLGVGLARRAVDRLGRRRRVAVGDVVLDRVAEEKRLLRHHRDLGAQRGLGEVADVVAVERDAAAADVVEARHQIDQGRLARSAHAHERHHLAAPDVQRDVAQGELGRAGIAERDVLEPQRLAEAEQGVGVGPVGDGRRQVEDLEHALDRRGRLLDGVHDARELPHRPVDQGQRRDEGEEIAGGHGAGDHLVAAVQQRAHEAEGGQHFHERLGDLVGAVVLERQVEQPAVHPLEALGLVTLAAEGLDDLHARERFVQQHVQLGDLLLRALVDTVQPAADRPHGQSDEGKDDQRDHGQPPLAHYHDRQQRDDHGDLPDGHDQHRGGHAGQPVDVGDDPRHQLGGVQAGEERQRHPLDVRVERVAQGGDHALADGGHQIGLAVAREPLDQVGPQQQQGNDLEHVLVPADEDVVERGLDQPGDRALHPGHDERQQRAQHQHGEVRPHERQQATVDEQDVSHARPAAATICR